MKDVMGIRLCSCSVGKLLLPFGAISGFLSGKVDGFYSQRPVLAAWSVRSQKTTDLSTDDLSMCNLSKR
jgi:hypothetical protein